MSRVRGELPLKLGADDALAPCLRAFEELGWEVTGSRPGALSAREDPAHLPCHHTPAAAELMIEPTAEGCRVRVETKVPGFGPLSSSHARGRQLAIVGRIHEQATRLGAG